MAEYQSVDPSILADLPPAVAALPIEIRPNGDRLILHTHVCQLFEISASGLRRLHERGRLTRAESAHNKSWYRAEDVAAHYRERHPDHPATSGHLGAAYESEETEIALPDGTMSRVDPTIKALVVAMERYIQTQSSVLESLTATNHTLVDSLAKKDHDMRLLQDDLRDKDADLRYVGQEVRQLTNQLHDERERHRQELAAARAEKPAELEQPGPADDKRGSVWPFRRRV